MKGRELTLNDDTPDVRKLFAALSEDPWRRSNPFSPEFVEAQEQLWHCAAGSRLRCAVLDSWMQTHQPCVFARFAASHGLLHYTFIDDVDILNCPAAAVDRVRSARAHAGRALYYGQSMGWILIIVSRSLASAAPDGASRQLAARLFELLIRSDPSGAATGDGIELDRIWLRHRHDNTGALCWDAPYNFFSAQADRRWWEARRFPGGWAFSLNSVGHSVAAGLLSPGAALRWAQRTMARSAGSKLCDARTGYSCDYNTDQLLPAEFFGRASRREHGPFVLTRIFEGSERAATAGKWSEEAERQDGRPFRTALSEVWFL